jgi:pimeloyl-ACP methyl ester carboxylesterase
MRGSCQPDPRHDGQVADVAGDLDFDPEDFAPRHDVPKSGRSGFTLLVGDRQVHYLEWGHRGLPPVVCLHGGGQTAYMYEELGAVIGGRYHVLAPDLPNHGDSDPLPGGLWGREALAESLLPLLAHFGFDRAAVVGASLGGITAMTLAAAHPELVSAIVLIDVGHRLEEEGVRKIVDFMRAHESFGSLEEAATEIAGYLPHRRNVRAESLSRNLRQRADGRWVWKHGMGRRWRRRFEEGGEAMPQWDSVLEGLDQDAASLACPVLVLRGAASDVLSDAGAAEVASIIPNARLATVENAGHLAAGDNPHSTVALIAGFLDEISP